MKYLFFFIGQAVDPNMLTIPGRRSVSSLKDKEPKKGDVSLDVPIFSSSQIQKLAEIEKENKKQEAKKPKQEKVPPKPKAQPPASITTVSENVPPAKKDESKLQKKDTDSIKQNHIEPPKKDLPPKPAKQQEPPKKTVQQEPPKKPTQQEPPKKPVQQPEPPKKVAKPIPPMQQENIEPLSSVKANLKPVQKPNFNESEKKLFKSSEDIQPSKVKQMIRSNSKDEIEKIDPPPKQVAPKRRIIENKNPVPRPPSEQLINPEQEELESMDFVRRPKKPPMEKQKSKDEAESRNVTSPPSAVTPNICIIPSTPAPPDSPDFVRKAAPRPPKKDETPQKPSTPPAATFQGNANNSTDEPLINKDDKKSGWI